MVVSKTIIMVEFILGCICGIGFKAGALIGKLGSLVCFEPGIGHGNTGICPMGSFVCLEHGQRDHWYVSHGITCLLGTWAMGSLVYVSVMLAGIWDQVVVQGIIR